LTSNKETYPYDGRLSPDAMGNYRDNGDNDMEFLDDDDVREEIESRMAMALHNQEYARQMSMEENRAAVLRGARRDPYGQISSGGQGDRDLYDSYSRNNPPRPRTGYKSNYAVDSSHYLDDSNYD
jgi:hypothetical protein